MLWLLRIAGEKVELHTSVEEVSSEHCLLQQILLFYENTYIQVKHKASGCLYTYIHT